MKYIVLDPPEREMDPMKLLCCSYGVFSWSTTPKTKPKKIVSAKGIKAKTLPKSKLAKRAKRKVAAA